MRRRTRVLSTRVTNTATGEVYIDRTASGDTDFDPTFTGVRRTPLDLHGGRMSLLVLIDASSVEVYAQNTRGEQVTLTDQIFPDPSRTGVDAFTEGGTATLDHMQAWQLKSIWPCRASGPRAGRPRAAYGVRLLGEVGVERTLTAPR